MCAHKKTYVTSHLSGACKGSFFAVPISSQNGAPKVHTAIEEPFCKVTSIVGVAFTSLTALASARVRAYLAVWMSAGASTSARALRCLWQGKAQKPQAGRLLAGASMCTGRALKRPPATEPAKAWAAALTLRRSSSAATLTARCPFVSLNC